MDSNICNHTEKLSLLGIISNKMKKETKLKLLFRASKDGFSAKSFHSKCDNKGATITIVRSEHNHVFGGFTTQSWESPSDGKWKTDDKAWLYVLRAQPSILAKYHFTLPLIFPILKEMQDQAIFCYSSCGPMFGGGNDITIKNNSNVNIFSFSNFPHSYYEKEKRDKKDILAGSFKFKVLDYEVFQVL